MPPVSRLALGLALLLLPAALLAAPSGPVESLRGALSTLAEPQRQAASDNLDAATAADREAAQFRQQFDALRAEAGNAPVRTAEFERDLQQDPGQALARWRARLPSTSDVDVLERLLEAERLEAERLGDRIARLTSDLGAALAPSASAAGGVDDLRRRLEDLAAPVPANEGDPAALTESRRLRQAAERRRVEAELQLREAERDYAATRQRLQELELRVLRQRLAQHEPRLSLLQQRIAELGREAMQSLADQVETRAAALPPGDAVLAAAAADNLALARELLAANEALAVQRGKLAAEEQALARDRAALRDSRTRLELGGRSEQVGTWLWAVLRRLESEAELSERLSDVRKALAGVRLRLIALDETQRELGDPDALARQLRANDPARQDEDGPAAHATAAADPVIAWLEARVDLAARLEPLLWREVAALEQAERTLQARLQATTELRQLLDRNLLWIRSHPPVDTAWFGRWPEGLRDLAKPSRFATTGRLLSESVAQRPFSYAGAVALVLALLWLRRRAPARLEGLAQAVREVQHDRYRRTLQSLGWTVLAALPGAAALWLAGDLLQQVGERGKYSDSLGGALQALAPAAFTLSFLAWLVRERGLAHAHFRWVRARREALQRWLPRLMAGLLPLYFIVALAFLRGQDLAIDVSARVGIVLASLLSAWALWRLLAPDALWMRRGVVLEPSNARRALRLALPAALLACAGLAIDGFVYSTAIVLDAQFASVGVFTAVAVVHGLLARWSALGERRLAWRRLEQRREAEAAARAEGAGDEDGGEALVVDVDADLALDKVNAQTRRLLRALKLVLLVLGLAWVWADVMPAFARLDEVVLWSIADTAADGASTLVPITLMAALLGGVTLALTFVAARNLPGLLEIGLLSKVNIDSASRYAITSLSRYAIVMVGIVVGLGLLGLRWSQLQWMAAALTVGLGFGLQEIFANFVSGLILLFERPFRVGDVITVNNLDGTVTRIRTRATTILDFDNKEIVVPNKTFITGQLVNWTLSDETTRIVVKVGVDYGTDPALVHRLLAEAAAGNPRVLESPAPRSWLLEFGANSLDFELRVFVGAISDRLAVRNELNVRLVELFEQHGVGFAYPQLDVHVRDLPAAPPPPPPAGARP